MFADPPRVRGSCPKKTRDAAGAKKLMDESGHADFEFDLISVDVDWEKNSGDTIAAQIREAGIKVKRTVLPGTTYWTDWAKFPFSMTSWSMRPLGVQILVLGYRSGEAWNETAYANPEFDKKLAEATGAAGCGKAQGADEGCGADSPGFRHHHPVFLALALQSLGQLREELHGMHPTFEHDFYQVWLDKEA